MIIPLLLVVLLSACSVLDVVFPKSTEIPPVGTVLFSDSFSSNESGWNTWNQNGSYVIYQADGLRFFVDKPHLDFYSKPGYEFTDVRIEVEAIKIAGPDNNTFGVICRMQDEKNYYAFVISSDGYAGIIKVEEGVYQLINSESMEFAPSVRQGEAINYLVVTCQYNFLKLDINGENQFSIQDNSFTHGDVGLIAGSFEEPGVDIFFDNLTVFQP
ncbi:MAG: hypothetical protein IH585_03075 [Anaerolineaceae bacterium]|nr:hypothetical protein [Anaerolineaceae bacterium]